MIVEEEVRGIQDDKEEAEEETGITPLSKGTNKSPPMTTALAAAVKLAKMWLKLTHDPQDIKPKRVCEVLKGLTDAECATACPGALLLQSTDVSLGSGVPLPTLDIKGKWSHNNINLTNDIVIRYAPHPATKSVPCSEFFSQMRSCLLHECHHWANKCVCQWCTYNAYQDCVLKSVFFSQYPLQG